jgi:hypothetical protein
VPRNDTENLNDPRIAGAPAHCQVGYKDMLI